MVRIYKEILLSHGNEWNAICSNVDRPRNCHTEWSKADKQILYDMWNLKKNGINEPIYKTEMESQI